MKSVYEELAQLVRRYPHVERVSCGHRNRTIYRRWAGTIASAQPSLVNQVVLNLQPDSAGTFAMEPPAYQLHAWDGSDLISHTVYVDQFDGPYRSQSSHCAVMATLCCNQVSLRTQLHHKTQ